MSARRLLILSLAAVLFLDLGRSYYARAGSATPTRMLRSDESVAHAIAWPPGVDLRADAPPGERVYAEHCAVCHGPDGKGNGPAAPSLQPRPRDFSAGIFRLKSTVSLEPPRLDDIRRTIRDGAAGTSMPAWRGLLSEPEIDAVAEHIRRLGSLTRWGAANPTDEARAELFTAADAGRGKKLYADLGCPACHGLEARGDGQSAPDLRDVSKQPIAARDLTAPWTYRWGTARATVYHWIAEGLSGTPMPRYLEVAAPQDIADIVVHLESIARRPPWEAGAMQAEVKDPVQRGKYLVRTGMCSMCHTPVDGNGIYQSTTHDLAGGMKIEAGAHGVFFAANLTPDDETGLGRWSEAQIAAAIQTGHTPDRRLNYWAMPWMVYGSLTADDALAVAAYLKTVRAVRNSIPDPLYYGSLETVARKALYPWPAVAPQRLAYGAGNFGNDEGDGNDRTVLQVWLLRGQRIFLLLAFIAWLIARRRPAADRGHGGSSMILLVLSLTVAASVAFVERYPALGPIPPGPIVGGFAQGIPAVTGASATALRARGRYLFAVSSCAFCHQGDGHGGNKVSRHGLGTAWSANLTPHETGLKWWSDDEILRALRSGVRRDGRQMHWQAMPWDLYSNYTEEDLRSLVGYVRGLPAVAGARRDVVAPTANDCASYTFWLRDGSDEGGCN